jgi:uncharacterized repeat protein (TIGR02059 family)
MAALQLRITSASQPVKNIPLNQLATIQAQPGATYSIIDSPSQKPVSGFVLKKHGDALVVEVDGQPVAQIEDFYAADQQAVFDTGMQGASGEPLLVTSSTSAAEGSDIVWQASAGDPAAASGWWAGLSTGEQLGFGALAVGGVAAAANSNSDGGNSAADTTAPTFVSAAANGNTVILTYDEALDASHAPDPAAFVVMRGGTRLLVTNVVVDSAGKTATLTTQDAPQPSYAVSYLSTEDTLQPSDAVTVSYADPTPGNDANAIQDAAGNDAATLVAQLVAPDTTPPVLVSAKINGNTLVMTYNEVLDAANPPHLDSFTVFIGSDIWNAEDMRIDSLAGTVTLLLPAAVTGGELVSISYFDGSDAGYPALEDLAGNYAASITEQPVTNNSPWADPYIVVFDLVDGRSSDHSGRVFNQGAEYTIYIIVDSVSANLNVATVDWWMWSGAENLGRDDILVLVGNGSPIEDQYGYPVEHFMRNSYHVDWYGGSKLPTDNPAVKVGNYGLVYRYHMFSTRPPVDIWEGKWVTSVPNGGITLWSSIYLTKMPAGIMTSQGLV